MFSSEAQLKKRTPVNGTDRKCYLTLLVDEYLHSSSIDAQFQILANFANFAYDPINYVYIRDVGVLDVFLHVIRQEKNQKLLHFATAGLCNLCIDPLNAEYILINLGLKPIIELLKSNHNETLANIITILIYFCNSEYKPSLIIPDIICKMREIKMGENKNIANLAIIFLDQIGEVDKNP